jgi:hypothetical protein
MLSSCQFTDCFFQAPPMEDAYPALPVDRDLYWDPCESDGRQTAVEHDALFEEVAALLRLAA